MRNPIRNFMTIRWQRQAATAAVAVFSMAFVFASSQGSPSPEDLLSPLLASATHTAAAANGTGYWIVTADGGVYAYGSAGFYGSLAGKHLAAPITGIVATADRRGYWLVAQDGGVFSFGDAAFHGARAGHALAPVVGIATSDGSASASGPTGATGATGQTGIRGAPGIQGPVGQPNYAYIFNNAAESVAVGSDVLFDSNGSMSGFVHTVGTAGITVGATGQYRVDFSASGTEATQFALMVNGVSAPGGVYGSGAGTQQDNGQIILALTVGDVLTLRNHTSAAAVTLAATIGGTSVTANASLLIEQLG